MQLRLVTYNIRKAVGLDWRRRPDRVLEVLAEIQADIVVLQEADQRLGKRKAVLSREPGLSDAGLRFVEVPGSRHSSGWHGNAILLGERLRETTVTPFALPSFEARGALAAQIEIEELKLLVVGVHLGLRRQDRVRQINALTSLVEAQAGAVPTVIMGDFNEWRKSPKNPLIIHHTLTEIAPLPTFHTSLPRLALDRAHLSEDIDVLSASVHDSALARRASDHLPLVLDVKVRGT